MQTFKDVKAKHQRELDCIQMENDMAETMLLANQKMQVEELLDNLTTEQRYWFLAGWNKRCEVDTEATRLSHEGFESLHNIYNTINKELGINEADLIT